MPAMTCTKQVQQILSRSARGRLRYQKRQDLVVQEGGTEQARLVQVKTLGKRSKVVATFQIEERNGFISVSSILTIGNPGGFPLADQIYLEASSLEQKSQLLHRVVAASFNQILR